VLGTNRDYSFLALDQYRASGGTALYDALWASLMHVKTVTGRKAIVVLSDGKDENNNGTAPGSTHSLEDVVTLAQQVGASIFPVGLGTGVERRVLEHVARASGGVAHFSPDSAQLADRFRRVVDNLRHRYVISYTSTNPIRGAAWRKVEVRPRQPGLVVSSVGGYVAAEE
jgi:Ca-activated chloride channel family protein